MSAPVLVDTNVLVCSEDFHDGQTLDGLRVIDPFIHDPEAIRT